eukprot:14566313-Heterocapsa_arctica.AAC.1
MPSSLPVADTTLWPQPGQLTTMPHGHSWARRRQHFNEGQLPGILEEGAGIPEEGAARPAPVP